MRALGVAGMLLLAGCASNPGFPDSDYWRVQAALLQDNGLLRFERAPADAPFNNADIAEAFRRIMFYDEYALEDGRFVERQVPRLLEKFEGPVTVSLQGNAIRPTDRRQLGTMLARLRRATGLQITETPELDEASVIVSMLDAVGRRGLADALSTKPTWQGVADELRGDLGGAVCVAYSLTNDTDAGGLRYLIVIPDELRGLMRQSCIEEEIGQAFGPSADWDGARPSVFNDDEEFALLTEHDEWLLRILYDARLRPGMTEAEGMPIARRILAELRPDGAGPVKRLSDRRRETDDTMQ